MNENQKRVQKKLGKFAESVYQHGYSAAAQQQPRQTQHNSMSGQQPQLLLHNPRVDNFLGPPGLAEAIRNPPGTLARKPSAVEVIPPWLARETLRVKSEGKSSSAASGSNASSGKGKGTGKAKGKNPTGQAKANLAAPGTAPKAYAIGAIPTWLAGAARAPMGEEVDSGVTVLDGKATCGGGKGKGKAKCKGMFLCQRLMRGQGCSFGSQCCYSHDGELLARVDKAHREWWETTR